jgi:hypothetical protein
MTNYFIRREITYKSGEHAVMFWRGEQQPNVWVDHPSDAAQFPQITAARTAFKRATGYFPGWHPQEVAKITVVGGP